MQPDRTSHLSHVRQTTGATDKRSTRHTGRRTTLPEKKQQLLPYVTPAGIFPYCKELCLTLPSGLFVIDIDHLDTAAEAEEWRNRLFADDVLHPDLAFISPGAKGVKLFVPYRLCPNESIKESFDKALHTAWDYLEWKHGLKVDTANSDMSRACFLAHDAGAKLRIDNG